MKSIAKLRTVIALLSVVAGSCSDAPLLAPSGSSIEIGMAPSVLASDGDTATLTVLVRDADGTPATNKTQISLIATGGLVCALNESQTCGSILSDKTDQGIVRAHVRSGTVSTLTIKVVSGTATASKDFDISGIVAPAGAAIVLQVADTLRANEPSSVDVFISKNDTTPVGDRTRVLFHSGHCKLSKLIALTNSGYVSNTVSCAAEGDDTLAITSGSVSTRRIIHVK